MGKTEELLKVLRKEFLSGKFKPGSKFPSEHKLMARFNASRVTVIKAAMQLAAEGFIEHRKQGAGTYVKDAIPFPAGHLAYLGPIASSYYSRVLNGIQLAAFQKNYAVSFFSPGGALNNHCLDKIRHSDYQGLLVANIGIIPGSFPIPVVYVDNGYETGPSVRASVTCTNYKGGADMAEAVIAHGHREILICTDLSNKDGQRTNRIQGFKDILQKHGIDNLAQRIFSEPVLDAASARFLLKKMLKRFPETTVIMADTDDIAAKLIRGMDEDMRKNCPAVITGFGNFAHFGGLLQIPGVEQHPEEIGVQSVNELFRMIEDPEYMAPAPIEVETELVNLDKLPWAGK